MSSNPSTSQLWPGVPLALGSAVLFGVSVPISKLLLGAANPWVLAGILYLGAGLGLLATLAVRRLLRLPAAEASLGRRDLPWLAAVVLFGGVVGPVLLMTGLSLTLASSASLLLNLEGLATMGIAWVVFHENVDRRLVAGALAILAGAMLLSWGGGGLRVDLGSLAIIGACLAWGIDNNLTRRIAAADPTVIATIKGLVAGAANLTLALAIGASLPAVGYMLAGAMLGFLSIGVSLVLFIVALRHLGAARTGAYFSLAPFIGAVVAVVVLGEPATPMLLAAGLLMAFGLWTHLAERHEHTHSHDALEHDHPHIHDAHHLHNHDGPVTEPHAHRHRHATITHSHPHYPDLHHRHRHG